VSSASRNQATGFVHRVADAAVRVPAAIGFTAIGAGVVVGRAMIRMASSILPAPRPETRHHAGRVREGAAAAEKAARASGLLSKRRPGRPS
jgi:hypothetical protein